MADLELKKYPDPVLKQVCLPVAKVTKAHKKLLADMLVLMREAKGVGLAAPQVGILERIIVVEVEGTVYDFINPEITACRGQAEAEEGCLSLPGICLEINRAAEIEVQSLDKNGKEFQIKADGLLARVIQHEADHLDGKMIIDRIPIQEYAKLAPLLNKLKTSAYCLGSIAF